MEIEAKITYFSISIKCLLFYGLFGRLFNKKILADRGILQFNISLMRKSNKSDHIIFLNAFLYLQSLPDLRLRY